MEKTVKHFCTTAKRIKKDAVEFAKQATMIAGMSAMVVTKMELQRLKEKLPNISIRYTGTGKDRLKFGVGMATTAAGIILALLGGGSEILTGGVSTAVVFRLLHRELRLQAPDWQSQEPHWRICLMYESRNRKVVKGMELRRVLGKNQQLILKKELATFHQKRGWRQ